MTQRGGSHQPWRGPQRTSSGPSGGRSKFKAGLGRRRRATTTSTRFARPSGPGGRRALCASKPVPAMDAAPTATRVDCVMREAGRAQPSSGMLGSRRTAKALAGQDAAGPTLRARRAPVQRQSISTTTNANYQLAGQRGSRQFQMPAPTNIGTRRSEVTSSQDDRQTDRGTKVRVKLLARSRTHGIECRSLIKKTRACSIRCPANFSISSRSQPTDRNSQQRAAATRPADRQQAPRASTYAQSMLSTAPTIGGGSSAGARPPQGSEIQVIIDRLRAKTERAKDLVAASNRRSGSTRGSSLRAGRAMNEMELIKSKSRVHQWHWSEMDKSHECIVSKDRLSLCFHPHCSESTALCRASEPLRRNGNYYYWEILVQDKIYGTSVMFGLCTKKQRMHANEYCNLAGLDDNGWSLSHKGLAWHQGKSRQFTDIFPENQPITLGLLYNSMRGELSYFMNGKNLGVAFSGLNQVDADLYPVAGSTAKCTQMRLLGAYCGNMTLLERASFTLLQNARDSSELLEYLRNLNLPTTLLEELTQVANVAQIPENCADGQISGASCADAKQEMRNFEDNGRPMNDANMSE